MNNVVNAILLTKQLAILREVAKDYPGKTIENIIQQMEARRNVSMGHDESAPLGKLKESFPQITKKISI